MAVRMSNRMPLAWHRKNYENFKKTLAQKEAELARITAEVKRMREEVSFRERQIQEAERRSMDGFDADRFLAKERKN